MVDRFTKPDLKTLLLQARLSNPNFEENRRLLEKLYYSLARRKSFNPYVEDYPEMGIDLDDLDIKKHPIGITIFPYLSAKETLRKGLEHMITEKKPKVLKFESDIRCLEMTFHYSDINEPDVKLYKIEKGRLDPNPLFTGKIHLENLPGVLANY